ncbi:hypothetical protein [Hydrogenophaga sp.]|uniref:hypothetical protein n=1 Tax=Hydrogenophaga sp. TaxID=1904254 RepID=UPI002637F13C|nr:hypothetical protein [Hydrogenophaga sp.]MCW5654855.1 hypothetical protein [Hydrogenophaga sp.]
MKIAKSQFLILAIFVSILCLLWGALKYYSMQNESKYKVLINMHASALQNGASETIDMGQEIRKICLQPPYVALDDFGRSSGEHLKAYKKLKDGQVGVHFFLRTSGHSYAIFNDSKLHVDVMSKGLCGLSSMLTLSNRDGLIFIRVEGGNL